MSTHASIEKAGEKAGERRASRVTGALEALGRASLRMTPQRIAIVRAFVDDDGHPTAQQIFERLHRAMPTTSFATVYNTLAALERAGSCRTLRIAGATDDGTARFDPNVAPHDHAVCDRCGAVRDVPAPAQGEPAAPLDDGFEVRSVERVYRGLCERCRKGAHRRPPSRAR